MTKKDYERLIKFLEAKVNKLTKTLRFYANRESWLRARDGISDAVVDSGQKARRALKDD